MITNSQIATCCLYYITERKTDKAWLCAWALTYRILEKPRTLNDPLRTQALKVQSNTKFVWTDIIELCRMVGTVPLLVPG